MEDFTKEINAYLQKEISVLNKLDTLELNRAINAIVVAWKCGANIYIMGNGGSAATASHFVCDFNKGISERTIKKFRLICLNDNIPIMTAIANDFSYDEIFSYQLKGILKSEDLIVAISGSGNSKNIIRAVEYAKECGNKVIGITGYDGGKLKKMADYSMHVDVNDMQIAEDVHMIFDHMMMNILCEKL